MGSGTYHGFTSIGRAQEMLEFMASIYRTAVVRAVDVPVGSITGCGRERDEVTFSKMRIHFEGTEHI